MVQKSKTEAIHHFLSSISREPTKTQKIYCKIADISYYACLRVAFDKLQYIFLEVYNRE